MRQLSKKKSEEKKNTIFQEYERASDVDFEQREEEQLEIIETLQIIIVNMKVKQFHDVNIVDFIKMFELIGDDDECEPVCDFGVFMSQDSSEVNLKTGDLLISIDEDDFLDKTSAQVMNYVKRLKKSFQLQQVENQCELKKIWKSYNPRILSKEHRGDDGRNR